MRRVAAGRVMRNEFMSAVARKDTRKPYWPCMGVSRHLDAVPTLQAWCECLISTCRFESGPHSLNSASLFISPARYAASIGQAQVTGHKGECHYAGRGYEAEPLDTFVKVPSVLSEASPKRQQS